MKSVPPPGAALTIRRMGFVGYCWACAAAVTAAEKITDAAMSVAVCMPGQPSQDG
jgi:dienelactone hydrolase